MPDMLMLPGEALVIEILKFKIRWLEMCPDDVRAEVLRAGAQRIEAFWSMIFSILGPTFDTTVSKIPDRPRVTADPNPILPGIRK